jgi:hypothetical protein
MGGIPTQGEEPDDNSARDQRETGNGVTYSSVFNPGDTVSNLYEIHLAGLIFFANLTKFSAIVRSELINNPPQGPNSPNLVNVRFAPNGFLVPAH